MFKMYIEKEYKFLKFMRENVFSFVNQVIGNYFTNVKVIFT